MLPFFCKHLFTLPILLLFDCFGGKSIFGQQMVLDDWEQSDEGLGEGSNFSFETT